MADLTIKKLEEVLDKKLGPIKKVLDRHSKKFDEHDGQFASIAKKLDEHDGQFASIAKTLDEHSQRLESLFLDTVDVQKKTDIIPDIYDIVKGTKEKVDELEQRTEVLENAA